MPDRYASLKQGLVGCWIPSVSGSGLLLPDLSGRNNNGALTNMDASDWVSAQYGRALDFDGSNDYVSCSGISLPQDQSYTACCFVRMPNVTDVERRAFFSTAGSPATFTVSLEWGNDGINGRNNKFQAFTETTVGPQDWFATSTTSAVANTWYHVASRVDTANDTIGIFVNGILEATTSFAGLVTKAGVGFNIGTYRLADGRFMDGVMDDVRLYSRALSEPEIRLLSSEPGIGFKRNSSAFATRYAYKPPKPRNYSVIRNRDPNVSTLRHGLVAAYCPSISGQGNVLPDLVGGNHGTLTNMDASDWVSGQYGRALDFDGSNDYVDFGSNINLAGFKSISYSAWVFRATLGQITPFARYVNTAGLGANRRADNFAVTTYTTAGQVYCGVSAATATGTDYIEFYSTETIVANQWNHIAAALFVNGNSSSGKIWINGKSAAVNIVYSGTPPTEFAANVSTGLYTINRFIGGNGVAVYNSGIVDDVRAYNRGITDSEAMLLASRPGIGLRQESHRNTFYQFPSGARRRRILTGMP